MSSEQPLAKDWTLGGRPIADGEMLLLKLPGGGRIEGSYVEPDGDGGTPWLRVSLPAMGGRMAHAVVSLPAGCLLWR